MTSMNFLNLNRVDQRQKSVSSRILNHKEFKKEYDNDNLSSQASRCMDCGTPFCHNGCPLNNNIPEWNELTTLGAHKQAWARLEETNNFPEFTGRICPAPCENVCTLSINSDPVSIRGIEHSLSSLAKKHGWIKARPAKHKTGKKVAVIGSGPCGLAAAQQLARLGHSVTVFDRHNSPGGLLTYGIPAFKLSKDIIEDRVKQLIEEDVKFKMNTAVGKDIKLDALQNNYDAVLIAVGANKPRELALSNYRSSQAEKHSKQILCADDFLKNQIELILKEKESLVVDAKNKDVIVIGGGDTGADCVGTSIRQGAKSVTQLEILPKPLIPKNSSSHEEGCKRLWSTLSTELVTDNSGKITALKTVDVRWKKDKTFEKIDNTEKVFPADLILYAIGYDGYDKNLIEGQELPDLAQSQFIKPKPDMNIQDTNLFAAGDVRVGPSLVVTAIREGRDVAKSIHEFLCK